MKLIKDRPEKCDYHSKYDSTTVRPNFSWTSFGVSIWRRKGKWRVNMNLAIKHLHTEIYVANIAFYLLHSEL